APAAAVRGISTFDCNRPRTRKPPVTRTAQHTHRRARMPVARSGPSAGRLPDDGRKDDVDRISEQDHLPRDSFFALVVRREVEPAILLDVTVVALHTERI